MTRLAALLAVLWASAASAQLPGSTLVEFPTSQEVLIGHLFKPTPEARSPAIVIVHGSGGVSVAREGFWGQELASAGMVALVTDSFTPRGVDSTVEDQSRVTTALMVRDAFSALAYLANQPFVDPSRIAIMGMSKGGSVALLASDLRALRGGRGFAAHIPLYPSCTAQYRNPRPYAPMLMLIGEDDNYTGVKLCAEYVQRIRAAGGKAELKTYPGAHHGFDGDTRVEREVLVARAQNFSTCLLYVEDDGRSVYARTGETLETPRKTFAVFQRDCLRTGATVAPNYRVKMQALEDVKAFLKTTLMIRGASS